MYKVYWRNIEGMDKPLVMFDDKIIVQASVAQCTNIQK